MDTQLTPERILIERKLQKKTDKYKEILSILDSNTVLCGGLILQSVIGEEWDTDIDIFTTNMDLTHLSFGKWAYVKGDDYSACIPGVIKVFTCEEPCKIDIIQITNLDELFEGFDFDFCKVWFDGQKIHMKNPQSILTKTCVVKNNLALRKPKERIPKYQARGFKIIE